MDGQRDQKVDRRKEKSVEKMEGIGEGNGQTRVQEDSGKNEKENKE